MWNIFEHQDSALRQHVTLSDPPDQTQCKLLDDIIAQEQSFKYTFTFSLHTIMYSQQTFMGKFCKEIFLVLNMVAVLLEHSTRQY